MTYEPPEAPSEKEWLARVAQNVAEIEKNKMTQQRVSDSLLRTIVAGPDDRVIGIGRHKVTVSDVCEELLDAREKLKIAEEFCNIVCETWRAHEGGCLDESSTGDILDHLCDKAEHTLQTLRGGE